MSAKGHVDPQATPTSIAATGALFVVATPIGNLADISQRAIGTLREVSVIYCEDTRNSQHLMRHFDIRTALKSLHDHNESQRIAELLQQIQSGARVALISDAGTPLISDPGYRVVAAIRAANLPVYAIPGPSAVIAALSVCGLATDRFAFEGFLPSASKARRDRLQQLVNESRTLVFYESSHRIVDALADAAQIFEATRKASVVKEITKQFEQCFTETLPELHARLAASPALQRGEFVLIIEPAPAIEQSEVDAKRIYQILAAELSPSQAAKLASKLTGVSRRKLYAGADSGSAHSDGVA